MNVCKIKRTEIPVYGVHAAGGSGGTFSDSFQQQLGKQRKEEFKKRVSELFDKIIREFSATPEHVDLPQFEKHRRLIRNLLNDVAENAYELHLERTCDFSGKQRVYAAINVIDQKLDEMAREILRESRDWFGYISRVDEIRGLIMDLLL